MFFFFYSTWKNYSLLMSAFDERPYFFPGFLGTQDRLPRNEHFLRLFSFVAGSRFPIFASARKRGQAGPQL